MLLEKVVLIPSSKYEVESVGSELDNFDCSIDCENFASFVDSLPLLDPQGSMSYIYRCRGIKAQTFAPNEPLGKLDIHWVSRGGQRGHLQTQAVIAPAADGINNLVTVDVYQVPERILVGEVFNVELRVYNNTEQTMGPVTVSQTDSCIENVVLSGRESFRIESLPSKQAAYIGVSMISLSSGRKRVGPIVVKDLSDNVVLDTLQNYEIFIH